MNQLSDDTLCGFDFLVIFKNVNSFVEGFSINLQISKDVSSVYFIEFKYSWFMFVQGN